MLSFKFRIIYNVDLAKKFFYRIVKILLIFFAKGKWPISLVRIERKRTKEKVDK